MKVDKERPNKNYDRTGKERMQKLRDRMRALGLVRKEIWIHPDDWPTAKRAVDKINKKRGLTP